MKSLHAFSGVEAYVRSKYFPLGQGVPHHLSLSMKSLVIQNTVKSYPTVQEYAMKRLPSYKQYLQLVTSH